MKDRYQALTLSEVFVVFQSLSRVWLFATTWTGVCQASLSFTVSQSLLKLMSIELLMPFNPLFLCHPLLLLPSIFPSIRSFPMRWLFTSDGQSIRASVSTSVLSVTIWVWRDWFPCSPRVFSNTAVQKHQFFTAQPYFWCNSHIHTWLLEKP